MQGCVLLAPAVAAIGALSRRSFALFFPILPAIAASFYLAILIPGIPFAFVMWKVRYDMDDWEDLFFECFPAWFVCFCVLVLAGPALAIGDSHSLILCFVVAACSSRGVCSCSRGCSSGGAALRQFAVCACCQGVRLRQKENIRVGMRQDSLLFVCCNRASACGCLVDRSVPTERPRLVHYPWRYG